MLPQRKTPLTRLEDSPPSPRESRGEGKTRGLSTYCICCGGAATCFASPLAGEAGEALRAGWGVSLNRSISLRTPHPAFGRPPPQGGRSDKRLAPLGIDAIGCVTPVGLGMKTGLREASYRRTGLQRPATEAEEN